MIKNYTDEEYTNKAIEANDLNKKLYILITPTEFTSEDEQGQPFTSTEDVATLVIAEKGYYITYNGNCTDGTINENLEQEKAEAEALRIQELYMTRSDFFDATIRAFGADEDDLLMAISGTITPLNLDQTNTKIALNNYKNALNFYRKHPLFNMLSSVPIKLSDELTITITSEQWDKFFDEMDKKNPDAYKILNGTYEGGLIMACKKRRKRGK